MPPGRRGGPGSGCCSALALDPLGPEQALDAVEAPLRWAAWLLGQPLPARLAGPDLFGPLAERAALRGWRLYLLGARAQLASEAARCLQLRYGVEVAGFDSPWVQARGSPRQELWLDRHALALGPSVAVTVGAGLAAAAGDTRRSRPGWLCYLGGASALLGLALRGRRERG